MSAAKRDYVDVIYNEHDRPLTTYPNRLARYLFDRYGIKSGQRFLDIGCGRGEFLRGFIDCGVQGYGVDRSLAAKKYCPEAELRTTDLEKDGIPYEDNCFDVIYSKSVIEHFHNPEKLAQEMFRVLKPGGLAITLCPDSKSITEFTLARITLTALPSCNRRCAIFRLFTASRIFASSALDNCPHFGAPALGCSRPLS